ncbi:MAG: hypothetical protein H5U08_17460 [Thermogutta sp.]|uniref:hypothetical protein n=1 Tax=Thermogutta sp. TaxID=1962930 RepID=UPI0019C54D98|nr:hypothetical protein [Thermogutta sp.]MBC7354146.1 hypothetical protein [Thermogutta sp.]
MANIQIAPALATIEPCFDSTGKGYEGESRRGTLVVPGVPSPRGVTIVVGAIHELPLPNATFNSWARIARTGEPVLYSMKWNGSSIPDKRT